MFRKILSCLLALVLSLSLCLTAAAETRPTVWDLTDIYADTAAAENDLPVVERLIARMNEYRGTMNTVENVASMYATFDECYMLLLRLYDYSLMRVDVNWGDEEALALKSRVIALIYAYNDAAYAVEDELFAQSDDFLDAVSQDERMTPYLVWFEQTREERAHTLTDEQENMLQLLDDMTQDMSSLYTTLRMDEMPHSSILSPNGESLSVDENNFMNVVLGDFSHSFKKEYIELLFASYNEFCSTFAKIYDSYLRGTNEYVKAHGYANVLEGKLAREHSSLSFYQGIIAASLQNNDLLTRYTELQKRALGLDEICHFDMNLTPAPDGTYTYDEACELVLAALSPLGERYVADARTLLASGWVHAYPAENKNSSLYSLSILDVHPYLLLNFKGTWDDVSTLATCVGIAMYQWDSVRTQTAACRRQCATLPSQVAAEVNVLLLNDYMIQNAATDAERMSYIASEMHSIYIDFFVQAKYTRFELLSVEALERGEALTADVLDHMWLENQQAYNGSISPVENDGLGWARTESLFNSDSSFRNDAVFSCAYNIFSRIQAGQDGALEEYLTFLSSGDAGSADKSLMIAGVDPSDAHFLDGLRSRFGELMDAYEAIEAK